MKKILVLMLAAIALIGCEDKVTYQFEGGQVVTLSTTMSVASNQQRVRGTLSGGQIDFTWEEGDSIAVVVGDKVAYFHICQGAGTSNATFVGTMPMAGNTFTCYYPATMESLYEQQYEKNVLPDNFYCIAEDCEINKPIQLIPFTSVLQIKLMGTEKVGRIDIETSENTYRLHCGKVELDHSPESFLLVVPNGQYSFKMVVRNENGVAIKTMQAGVKDFTNGVSMPTVECYKQEHQYVDMGFAKFATCNIGAESEEEYGDYFYWGEKTPEECRFDTAYIDAARENWGEDWAVPSKDILQMLLDSTTREMAIVNGVKGIRYTSVINGNTIFLPYGGYIPHSHTFNDGLVADYWSSDISFSIECQNGFIIHGWALRDAIGNCIFEQLSGWCQTDRCPIRPVYVGQ